MHDTLPLLQPSDFPPINRRELETLQINIGLRCNQACLHCHVNSNPYRKEKMDEDTIALIVEFLQKSKVRTLDITGGAPELHQDFRTSDSILKDQTELNYHQYQNIHNLDHICNLLFLYNHIHLDFQDLLVYNLY